MKRKDPPALIVIDVQQGFDDPYWGQRNNPDAEKKIALLLSAWRKAKYPIIHFQHLSLESNSPLREDRPGHIFKPEAEPKDDELQMTKHVNSCFIGTKLEETLRIGKIQTVVLCGLTTDHCVSTTTRMAGNLGFTAYVVSDATATFGKSLPDGSLFEADLVHRVALASLHNEFAEVITAEQILSKFDLLGITISK
jgi:nicotinamidase-related amidase